jgi:hypothetical protein
MWWLIAWKYCGYFLGYGGSLQGMLWLLHKMSGLIYGYGGSFIRRVVSLHGMWLLRSWM